MVATLEFSNLEAEETTFERRIFPRKVVHARVQGHRLDHTIAARRQPALALDLRDVSLGGLSALTDTALDSGEHISVAFPATRTNPSWDAFGRILRCTPGAMGYRIAVEFDPLPAA